MHEDVFVIDDEVEICRSLCELLESRGYRCAFEARSDSAAGRVRELCPKVVLLDIRMPEVGGMDLLQVLRRDFPDTPVIMITGHATVENAVKAMRFGAANFLTKPVKLPELIGELERLIHAPARESPAAGGGGGAPSSAAAEIGYVTKDPEMLRVLEQAERAAATDATVLITGESGTGKELIANLIHHKSDRAAGPFIKINCAAIPDDLLESELFGHEAGAFTDARKQKTGLFETARSGTLFLDEIGDMSSRVQAKMLRVLQDQRFTRLGGNTTITTDVRIVAATNRTIEELMEGQEFRSDLYYRISVVHLALKPLRARDPRDVELLAEHFLSEFSAKYHKPSLRLGQDLRRLFERHSWPGNVRELRNLIERLVIFSDGEELDGTSLPEQYAVFVSGRDAGAGPSSKGPAGELSEMSRRNSRELVIAALNRAGGVKQEAARLLNVNRKTLYNWMRKLDLL